MKTLGTMIVALLLVGAVFAGEETLTGAGTLTAQGRGIVKITGAGDFTISGNGMLYVIDCSVKDNIQIQVEGKGKKIKKTPSAIHAYKGFNGTATITGSLLKIWIEGKDIQLTASGKGRVHLFGRGTYQKNNEQGQWSELGEGTPVDVGTVTLTD